MPDVTSHLRDAGFNDDEISSWSTDKRQQLAAGGFTEPEIDDYFGMPKTPDKVPESLIDRFIGPSSMASIESKIGAIGKGAAEGFGEEPLGAGPQARADLQRLGILPKDGAAPLRFQTAIDALAKGTDALMRGFSGFAGGVAGLVEQSSLEEGGNAAEAARQKRDVFQAINITALLLSGDTPMSRVTHGPMGEVKTETIGGLPKGEDFSTAGTVIGNGDTTPAMEQKLADLYEQKGIHPAEVAHDAQTDPTIAQSILSSDPKDMPEAYGPPPKPPEPPAPPAGEPPPYTDAEKQILSKISIGEESPKSKLTWNDLYTNFVDKLFPISKAVKDVGAELSAEDNPYQRARLLSGYVGKADHFLNQGTFDFTTYENNGPSLKAILAPVGDLNGFRAYATAQRALELEGRGIKSGFAEDEIKGPPIVRFRKQAELINNSLPKVEADHVRVWRGNRPGEEGKATAFTNDLPGIALPFREGYGGKLSYVDVPSSDLAKYENKAGTATGAEFNLPDEIARKAKTADVPGGKPGAPPLISSGLDAARTVVKDGAEKYEKPFRALVDYQNRVSQYLRDSGVLSDAGYKAMVEANKMYVPFSRVMGLDAESPHVGGSTLQAHNPIKAIKGSARDIIDPIESVVRNTYHFVEMAEKNVVGTKLVDMLAGASKELPEAPAAAKANERIVSSAIKYKGKIYTGVIHSDAYEAAAEAAGIPVNDVFNSVKEGDLTGFITDTGRYVSREEAKSIAEGAGQLSAQGKKMVDRPELIAQDLKEGYASEGPRAGAIADALGEIGVKSPDDLAASLAHASAPVRQDEIAILRNGKRETYTVDADLARAMKGLDAQSMGLLEKIISYPASLLRAGAVLTPDFAIRHTIRDFLYAATTFKDGIFHPGDMAKGFTGLIMKDEDYWNWLKGGGGNISLVGIDRRYMQEDLRKLTGETGLVGRAWNVITDPDASMWEKTGATAKLPFQAISKFVLDPLRLITQFAENASHLAAFKKTMRASEAAGPDNLRSQIINAAWASRDTAVDAARMGANMRAYNMITAFANIKLQDTDRVVRAIKDNPIATLTKIGGAITVPTVLLWAANHNDPRYAEIPQWQKDLFWIVMTPDTVFRVPKPWAMGQIFGSLPERMLNEFVDKNPDAFKEFFKDLWATSGPDFVPSAASPIIDQFANRSTFTNRTLIPSEQEKFLPEYQYTPYTTELTKSLGKIIGAFPGMSQLKMDNSGFGGTARALTSPILMENYIRGWSGTLGVYALNAADAALRKTGALPDPPQPASTLADIPVIKAFVIRYPSASAESIQGFYDTYAENKAYFDTWMAKARDGDIAAVQHIQEMGGPMMFVQLDGIKAVLTEHNQLIRDLYKNPEVPPDEKRQLVDQLYFSMIQVARAGNQAFRQIKDAATVRGALLPTSGPPESVTAP